MDKYFCPKCKAEAKYYLAGLFLLIKKGISPRRLDIPYYTCSNCRLVGLDKKFVRDLFNDHYQDRLDKKVHCYYPLYREVLDCMQEIIDRFKNRSGYKEAKFVKKVTGR